jgi:hypothetical protein
MEKIKVKAISIKQPWADMIMNGQKKIEVRTWKTRYRGDIIICASRNPKSDRSGVALCIAELYDVRKITKIDETDACCEVDTSKEYAWCLRNVRPLKYFPPAKGKLSIYDIELPKDSII